MPSPPVIDLRDVERKLSLARDKSDALEEQFSTSPPISRTRPRAASKNRDHPDEDFFAAFDRDPGEVLRERQAHEREKSGLTGAALDEMNEAQATPLEVPSREARGWMDYLIGDDERIPEEHGSSPQKQAGADPHSLSSASPGSWGDTAKRTWGSFKGISTGVLHRATDILAPPDDEEFQEFQEALSKSPDKPKPRRRSSLLGAFRRQPPPRAETAPEAGAKGEDKRRGASADANERQQPPKGRPSSPKGWLSHDTSQSLTSSWHAGGTRPDHSSLGHPHGPATAGPISGAPGFNARESKQWNTGHWKMDAKVRTSIPVTLTGRRDETSEVIESWHSARLQAALPPRLQLGKTWRLLYSLDQHGISLGTLYHNVGKGLDPSQNKRPALGLQNAEGWLRGATGATQAAMSGAGTVSTKVGSGLAMSDAGLIIAVKDADDNVFGAFVNERLRPSPHYYGSGECFLWKTTDRNEAESGVEGEYARKRIKTYKWTARNDYMVLTEAHFLSVGGGDGKYGLWIDDALENGVSSRCPAFDNDILCNDSQKRTDPDEKEGRFECLGLEVWAVGTD